MNTAEALIKLLEKEGIDCVFGHPGEQILPFYKALSKSEIKHVLTRHEQGAAHACDAYGRSSGKYGVCVSTAGPGAMNLVMGVATAFKDSVPMLVITGDNDYSTFVDDKFQSFPINDIFSKITVKSFHPHTGRVAIRYMKEALEILKKYPKGPVHINLSKDILLDEDLGDILDRDFEFIPNFDNLDDKFEEVIEKLNNSKRPLIIAGTGVIWGNSIDLLEELSKEYNIPITTTYQSKGIISEEDELNLGIVGLRGDTCSDYAFLNSDCILVLGSRLSERTIAKAENYYKFKSKIIHINIDKKCLNGKLNICQDVYNFLECLLNYNSLFKSYTLDVANKWIDEIYQNYEEMIVDGINDDECEYSLLRPPYVINKIINKFKGSYFLSDAGTHTTWTTLLSKSDKFGKLLFSGGFGPMGYGLPGAIGVAFAHPQEKVVVICGDGDIQMVSQELATIVEYNLNISIFIINNSQLGIIRQWEDTIYDFDEHYQVDLKNPDFVKLADAYNLKSFYVDNKDSLSLAIDESYKIGPCLVDVNVIQEDIPMPK